MQKKTKLLMLSLAAVTVSATVVAGGTYALFTGRTTVNNHLKAGNLTIGLQRTTYTAYVPDEQGFMAEVENATPVDLTKNAAPVFSVEGAVPGCWYLAKVAVSNEGSVAFEYGLRILWEEEKATKEEKLFADQIVITVYYGNNLEKSFPLDECAKQENEVDLGVLLKGAKETFKVKAAFLNANNNDDVQGASLAFDLQVFATQYVNN